ncbi:hypothetical protein, partial [Leptospira interrogans]|uniref:hypothetical protein n=1 Tax=Leptospira interrogans TaxID=173 RepID=UPI000A8EB5A9
PDFCKFDLRDAETFFFQSGSSHIYLNKAQFFGKAVVPTFYPFVPFVRSNCDQNKSSLHSKPPTGIKVIFSAPCRLALIAARRAQRLPASKLYSAESQIPPNQKKIVLNAYRHQSYIQRRRSARFQL